MTSPSGPDKIQNSGHDLRFEIIYLWCSSLSHRYFCTAKIGSPNLGIFLIPLVKSFVLTIQRNPQEGL